MLINILVVNMEVKFLIAFYIYSDVQRQSKGLPLRSESGYTQLQIFRPIPVTESSCLTGLYVTAISSN